MILRRVYSNRVWIERVEFSLKLHNKVFVQTFRCAVALWKSWVYKYSIRFQVIKLKLLCETLKNEKWKILAWYPNKMRRYCQRNPKCGDWRWTNFQMQVTFCHLLNRFSQPNGNCISSSWKWFNIEAYTRCTWFHFELNLS